MLVADASTAGRVARSHGPAVVARTTDRTFEAPPPLIRAMDRLDAAILREMYRGRVLLWGGGDPRLATPDLARRLGVDRSTVWSRLKAWREAGFLVRQEVVPNPSLFGAGLAGGDVRVDDPRRKGEVLEALALVDGVLAGVDQVGPYVLLLYAQESEAALGRCTRLVGKLPGVDAVSLCIPFEPPASALAPTAADWRILASLRTHAEASLADVARTAGVSRRTLDRRYRELLASRAIWTFPVLDFTRYRGAVLARFVVLLENAATTPGFLNRCRRELPSLVWWDAMLEASPRQALAHPWVDLYCHLEAVADVEALTLSLLAAPGVRAVETYFPKAWFVVPSWFDERIAKMTGAAPARRGRR